MTATAHIWKEASGFYWDDAEDHGGFDRDVPSGPFVSISKARVDARRTFNTVAVKFIDGKPDRYKESVA